MKKLTLALPALLILSACVNPEVVSERTLNDADLTCEQIVAEASELATIRTEADAGRKVSGANVAAALLFWPAIIGNSMNATQAIEAANKREVVLAELSEEKGC